MGKLFFLPYTIQPRTELISDGVSEFVKRIDLSGLSMTSTNFPHPFFVMCSSWVGAGGSDGERIHSRKKKGDGFVVHTTREQ